MIQNGTFEPPWQKGHAGVKGSEDDVHDQAAASDDAHPAIVNFGKVAAGSF